MTVHAFGPIAKWWLPRRSKAGTFDQTWKATRHPKMPKNYSFAYWSAAHPRLQIEPKLKGEETIRLRGLFQDQDEIERLHIAAHKMKQDVTEEPENE